MHANPINERPAFEFKRIDHIQVCIPNGKEDEAREFYCGLLKMLEIPKPLHLQKNGGFWLKLGDISLHIGAEKKIYPSKRHPAFEIGNYDAFHEFLQVNKIRHKVDSLIGNTRRISFYDPFGNRFEVLDRPIEQFIT